MLAPHDSAAPSSRRTASEQRVHVELVLDAQRQVLAQIQEQWDAEMSATIKTVLNISYKQLDDLRQLISFNLIDFGHGDGKHMRTRLGDEPTKE